MTEPSDRNEHIRSVRNRLRDEDLRQLRLDIGQLSEASSDDDVAAILTRIAALGLDELARERLLQTIRKQVKTPIATLRKQLNASRKQHNERNLGLDDIDLVREHPGGPPLALESNAIALIRAHPAMRAVFGLDEFRQRSMVLKAPPWARPGETFPRPTRDDDLVELLAWVQRQGIHIRGKVAIRAVIAPIVRDHPYHPIRDYLNGLKWDRVLRLDTWLTYYLGVAEVENYTAPAGRMWMISAVARVFNPGCIVKYVLVTTGNQDLGKSTAFSILGGEWYTDDMAQLGTKDSQIQAGNAWIVELAELDSMKRADISATKAFISRKVDQFRPPYGEHLIQQERQCVLAATVNPAGPFLHDETGNVRFWPVLATRIDLDALRQDRDQLWAEATHHFKADERWWPGDDFNPAAAQDEASETAESDPWFDPVQDWITVQTAKDFAVDEILAKVIEMRKEHMTRAAEMRLATSVSVTRSSGDGQSVATTCSDLERRKLLKINLVASVATKKAFF
jgi:putative DNA primase/helicase